MPDQKRSMYSAVAGGVFGYFVTTSAFHHLFDMPRGIAASSRGMYNFYTETPFWVVFLAAAFAGFLILYFSGHNLEEKERFSLKSTAKGLLVGIGIAFFLDGFFAFDSLF